MKAFVLFACFQIFQSAAFAQNSASDRFRSEEQSIVESVEAGKLTASEGAREILSASKAHFPTDTLTHSYYESVLDYATRMSKKEITPVKAQELLAIRTTRYHEALRARDEENRLKIAQQEFERQREHELQQAAIEEQRKELLQE